MAEIKNSFLRSKMNKDLDDRLIPNGEYRDAQNISVGKSEADDIGALETVLGNTLVNNFGLNGFEVIGYKSISSKNVIIVFLTNNTNHYIYSYTPSIAPVLLVTGSFLNFSTSNPITGISVIENLLFWTDNKNQPRKININTATSFAGAYYTEENHISVAKYNPYQPIGLLQKVVTPTTTNSSTATLLIANTTGIQKGMSVVQYNNADFGAEDYFYVTTVNTNTSVVLNAAPATVNAGDITFLATTMTGENITFDFNQGNNWPGDPDYLESKFVRLSYRFEFDDGEYSIMAPFTQICFIPKQKGYFLENDEDEAYRSTILEFMENGVQNIDLLIPFPDVLSNCQPGQNASYKIKSIDILYKESDGLAVKVIDSVSYNQFFLNNSADTWVSITNSNIFTYNYQSRKPFRTLPQDQTTRVYDKVPVKALAQETSGNRIMYGNFLDKYTSPETLDYIVGVGPKSLANNYNNWIENPNHSVKQNRNYQVGFVLADKFGRQSDVILSGIKLVSTIAGDGTVYGGDTIYNPFNSAVSNLNNWFGDALKVDIETPITVALDDNQGTPGLYANTGTGYNTFNANTIYQPTINNNTYVFNQGPGQNEIPTVGSFLEGEFTDYVKVSNVASSVESTTSSDNTAGGSTTALVLVTGNANIKVGMIVTGGGLPAGVTIDTVTNANNFVLSSAQNIPINSSLTYSITKYTVTTNGQASSIYLQQSLSTPDIKYKYSINSKGWYSYKIVVKQQEQDYYNAYLPGILKGYPQVNQSGSPVPFPNDPSGSTSNIVLINDNINKIPRDLSEVGPQQKQFRSSVQLSARVQNTVIGTGTGAALNNIQYFPGINTDTAISIATTDDSNMDFDNLSNIGQQNIYQIDTKPLIARLATSTGIGVITNATANLNMKPFLAIYETEPQDSLLDIFWETPTVGLISTLNDAIRSDYEGAVGWSTYDSNNFNELDSGNFLTGLSPVNQSGNNLIKTQSSTLTVINDDDEVVTDQFSITRTGLGTLASPHLYNFAKVGDNFVYNYDPNPRSYTISMVITNNEPSTPVIGPTLNINVYLQNKQPVINGGNALPAVNNINQNFQGTIATITGDNGAANSSLKLEQKKWSISNVSPSVYNGHFSINETSGVITKTNTGSNPGTCTLTIKLEDAYNGSALASGSKNRTATQQINIVSATIGYFFYGGANTVFLGACPAGGAQPSGCSSILYYSQSTLVNGLPTAGSLILDGPDGPGVSNPIASGYYSIGQCATGAARKVMKINGSGEVMSGYPASCGA